MYVFATENAGICNDKQPFSRSSIVSHARIANFVLLAVFVLAWAPAMILHKGKMTSRLSLSMVLFLLVEVAQTGPLVC